MPHGRCDPIAWPRPSRRCCGRPPAVLVCATVGTTSSLGFDPLRSIGEICRQHNVWLHVDAALAGTAAICPEFRAMHDGLELADSYCFNPHKWMFTNFDCSCFFVADRGPLIRRWESCPSISRTRRHSRRGDRLSRLAGPAGPAFPRLEVVVRLAVVRHRGNSAACTGARGPGPELAGWIEADPRFDSRAGGLNLVCFRHRGGDEVNQRIFDRVNASGKLFMSHTRLHDRLTLRFCVGQTTPSGGTSSRHGSGLAKRQLLRRKNLPRTLIDPGMHRGSPVPRIGSSYRSHRKKHDDVFAFLGCQAMSSGEDLFNRLPDRQSVINQKNARIGWPAATRACGECGNRFAVVSQEYQAVGQPTPESADLAAVADATLPRG